MLAPKPPGPVAAPGHMPQQPGVGAELCLPCGRWEEDAVEEAVLGGVQLLDAVDQPLVPAVEDGVSVFILASDDPHGIEHFASETMPAVREHLARGRP